jgi:type II secretory pathway pseudopilin PulG
MAARARLFPPVSSGRAPAKAAILAKPPVLREPEDVGQESGFVLLGTLILLAVMAGMVALAVTLSIRNLDSSSRNEAAVQADASANAGLAAGYHAIASAPSVSALPCSVSGTLPTEPGSPVGTYSDTITYYASPGDPPPSSSVLSCSELHSGTVTPKEAEISSIGEGALVTAKAYEQVNSLVALREASSGYSIYTDQINLANNVEVTAGAHSQPTLYVAGTGSSGEQLNCANGVTLDGTIVSRIPVQLTNNCTFSGSVWSRGDVTLTNAADIEGGVTAYHGGISLSNDAEIGQSASASYGISLSGAASIGGSQDENQTGLPDPPAIPFPQLTESSQEIAAWQSAGYQVIADNDCNTWSGDTGSVYALLSKLATASQRELIETSCAINLANNTEIGIDHSVAIFSTGGFNFVNNSGFESVPAPGQPAATSHYLYLVVPYGPGIGAGGTVADCGADENLANNASDKVPLDTLVYTPCQVNFVNNTSMTGEIIAGEIETANHFVLTYAPIPIPGLNLPSAAQEGGIFTVDVLTRWNTNG